MGSIGATSWTRLSRTRVASGPGQELHLSRRTGRHVNRGGEHPGAADMVLGDGVDDVGSEFHRLRRDIGVGARGTGEIPAVNEEVNGREAQAVADAAPTDRRVD